MKILFKAYWRKLVSDLHSAIVGAIVGLIVLAVVGAGGIYVFSKNLWNQIKPIMLIPTPLWVIIIFFALFLVAYLYLRSKTSIPLSTPDPEYREEFHVYWDTNNKMRCLNCGKPLKYSSSDIDSSIFYCSDPMCNSKHVLRDKIGYKLSEQEAIDRLKPK